MLRHRLRPPWPWFSIFKTKFMKLFINLDSTFSSSCGLQPLPSRQSWFQSLQHPWSCTAKIFLRKYYSPKTNHVPRKQALAGVCSCWFSTGDRQWRHDICCQAKNMVVGERQMRALFSQRCIKALPAFLHMCSVQSFLTFLVWLLFLLPPHLTSILSEIYMYSCEQC